MGAVIGRGGSRISEIRMLSTQEIKIHEVEGESPVRRITIQGCLKKRFFKPLGRLDSLSDE